VGSWSGSHREGNVPVAALGTLSAAAANAPAKTEYLATVRSHIINAHEFHHGLARRDLLQPPVQSQFRPVDPVDHLGTEFVTAVFERRLIKEAAVAVGQFEDVEITHCGTGASSSANSRRDCPPGSAIPVRSEKFSSFVARAS